MSVKHLMYYGAKSDEIRNQWRINGHEELTSFRKKQQEHMTV